MLNFQPFFGEVYDQIPEVNTIKIFARSDISKFSELTIDYGLSYFTGEDMDNLNEENAKKPDEDRNELIEELRRLEDEYLAAMSRATAHYPRLNDEKFQAVQLVADYVLKNYKFEIKETNKKQSRFGNYTPVKQVFDDLRKNCIEIDQGEPFLDDRNL